MTGQLPPVTLESLADSISDVATSLSDMATMFAGEFTSVRQEIAGVRREVADLRQEVADVRQEVADVRQEVADVRQEVRQVRQDASADFDKLYSAQRETNERLQRLEDNGQEYANDIRALYEMIADLQKEVSSFTQDERQRLADLEAFAMRVAEKTGIPYSSKPKLRS